ncbi:hypothetical protein Acr_00g0007140 [Actinidia rufa]|uniref:Uncharacterized protein n=1 Tax=Actinidia rufa TaxID=165716 RepID=A0A7J0D894_9ERIC|nr:hypothetical protein Acr_00g0007140 [Actinidia rufa]
MNSVHQPLPIGWWQVRRPSTITELVALGLSRGCLSPNPLDRGKTSPWDLAKSYPLSSPEPPSEYSSELAQSQSAVSSSPLGEVQYRGTRAIVTVGCSPGFLPQQFGAVCGNDSSLCTCAAATYPDQVLAAPWISRAPPMANASQVPDLEGLHHEIHGMAEQMRVMNENNARLIQLLATANPQPPAAPSVPDVERSRHSNRSGDRSHNVSTERARDRHRAPSPSLRERSSSSESSQTRFRVRRGRSPHRGGHTRARDKSTSQKIRDLDARLDAINTGTNAPITVDALVRQTDPPFTERVLRTRISLKFKLPTQLGIYEGKTDPMDHLSKADKYIAAEELAEAKRRRRGKEDHKRKEPDMRPVDYREEMRYKRPDRDSKRSNNRRPRTLPRRPEFNLPSLNTPVAQVLSEIKHEEFIKWPEKIKTDPQKRNRNKYYRPPPDSPERKYGDNRPTAGNIQTIHGGFGSGGCSTSSRKRHARSAFRSVEEEVYNLSSPCVSDQPPITFSSDDLRGLHLPHDDALVVSAVIANFSVQRILIDSGSCNLLEWSGYLY